mmetsp:Transcript_107434/g.285835  ORF Transcript_107434/g.285835 Transcript_107434/m.285835 type:complete len:258 (-) Transcript_107434:481-1254(-)
MWRKVRKSISCGSLSPFSDAGAVLLLCTCEIQSKSTARVTPVTCTSDPVTAIFAGPSSRKTLHLATATSARFPPALRQLPQMSSSSRPSFTARAAAKASAPASPTTLSRRESLLSDDVLLSISAIASAPASPMQLSPKQSSRTAPLPGVASARETALAPRSRKEMPLSSSSGRRGGPSRHSKPRAALQESCMWARSMNVGSQSMNVCSNSGSISGNRRFARRCRAVEVCGRGVKELPVSELLSRLPSGTHERAGPVA